MNFPDDYRFTKSDVEQAHDILRRYWMRDTVSPPTMDEVDFAELAEFAERMANGGRLPTIGDVDAKLARDKAAHDLRNYESAQKGGGLYCSQMGQIYWAPERLSREKRERLAREQRAALR